MQNETFDTVKNPREGRKERSVEELRILAFTDELTGLKNRRFLRTRLSHYIDKASKSSGEVTLSILDLDGFKQINDTYGHLAGDYVLKVFAELFKDTLDNTAIPVRFAGDEFVAIFTDKTKTFAKDVLEGLLTKVRENPVVLEEGKEITVNVSIGIANYPSDALDNDSLFRRADEALYYAKGAGKNRVISYPKKGKLVTPGNISTIFPISKTVGFDSILHELKMLTINRIVSEDIEPELPIIFGSRGSGKSRLLGELVKKANSINRKVLYLKGIAGNNRPYYALSQAFKKTLENETDLIKVLVEELSLSELKVISEDIPEFETISEYKNFSDLEVADKDTVLFQGLVKVLFGLLRTGRILMVVDDAHNLDQVSLEFIDSFIAEFPSSEIDLIFSLNADTREERSKNTAFLLGNVSRIVQLAELHSFDMPPLQIREIASMLGEITGLHDFPDNLLQVLEERTGGNPMFLEELLQLILEREIISYNGTRWVVNEFSPDNIPKSLNAILEERADRLSSSEKDVLLRASIIGEIFDIRVLASMCKKNEQEVLKDIEGARRAHIITEVKGRENEFSFHSEFTRSLFYSKHDPKALKQAHIEAAGLELDMNKGRESEVYGKVARHYQQAGDWRNAARIIATSKERSSQAKIPEATRRMLQRKAFESDMAKESPLEKEDIAKAVKVMRDVKVAAQALRLYPRENENVGKAIDKSLKGIKSFFDKTEVLTFSVANDDVLINGQNPGPEDKDSRLADEFRQLISPYALQGIIFTKGLVQEELERFLALFSRKPEEVADKWEDILIEEELRHVRPDRKIYVALGQSKVTLGNAVINVDTAKSDSEGESGMAQAALDSIRKLVDEFQNESQELLEAIKENRDSSREMEKLILLLEEIAGYIPDEIKAEMAEKQESTSETGIETIEIINEIDKIVDEEISEEYSEKKQAFKTVDSESLSKWISDLGSDNRIVKARAAQGLLHQGKTAISPCLKELYVASDEKNRRLLATIIHRIGKTGELMFASAINNPPNDDALINLLSTADVFHDSSIVGDSIGTAIRNPNKEVQKATIRALTKFPVAAKCSAAITALSANSLEINALGMYLIGVFRLTRLLSKLTEAVAIENVIKKPNMSLVITAIRALGCFDNDVSIDSLSKVVLFESVGEISERIRFECLSALAKIGSASSIGVLSRIAGDSEHPDSNGAKALLKGQKK